MYDYMTELGCEWSILILLHLTTSLSVRKLGLRAGGGRFYLTYSPDALRPTSPLPDVRGTGHLEEYVKSQWHPPPILRYSKNGGFMGLLMCLLLPCSEFKLLLPRDILKTSKFQTATSISRWICEDSNKVAAGLSGLIGKSQSVCNQFLLPELVSASDFGILPSHRLKELDKSVDFLLQLETHYNWANEYI